jgi:hypothetical protein
MKKIIYNKSDGLYLITPNIFIENELENAIMIAEKDVPSGINFKIYDASELPMDQPFETWVCNITEGNKDGVGLTKEEFIQKYPQYKDWAVQ